MSGTLTPATLTVSGCAHSDACGSIDSPSTGTIHFTTTDPDPGAVLSTDYTFAADDGGVITFSSGVTMLFTSGPQTLTVTALESGSTGSTVVAL
jgi:hypothetical protein